MAKAVKVNIAVSYLKRCTLNIVFQFSSKILKIKRCQREYDPFVAGRGGGALISAIIILFYLYQFAQSYPPPPPLLTWIKGK
jgi:hypothetical protein